MSGRKTKWIKELMSSQGLDPKRNPRVYKLMKREGRGIPINKTT